MDEVRLAVGADDQCTPAVLDAMAEACDRVERAGSKASLLLRLDGATTGPERLPFTSGIHVVNHWERALRRVERLPVPTLAVATGECRGLAAEALLVADLRLVSPDFTFQLCGDTGGRWPSMAVHRLSRQVAAAAARRLVLFGDVLDAATAMAVGIVDRIAEDSDAGARVVLDGWRDAPPLDIAMRRSLLLEAFDQSHEDALGAHLAACDRILRRHADLETVR
ncbi:enoyl-CoA-hydratase DpgB [Nonomuraea sp. NPDC050556]|uniref:enoyl-CoA-hydratase DpgB n=1 Tax=Nonomuraea sp. NPDC050556 TaxID=3364369 RepID=UPI0037977C88